VRIRKDYAISRSLRQPEERGYLRIGEVGALRSKFDLIGNECACPCPKYAIDTLGVIRQVHLPANVKWHLPDKPHKLRLHLLLRGEIAFDKDLECVADDLRVFITEGADALLQLDERMQIVVEPALY